MRGLFISFAPMVFLVLASCDYDETCPCSDSSTTENNDTSDNAENTGTKDTDKISLNPPKATSKIEISANLDSTAEVPAVFDMTAPVSSSNISTAITVYDSLGDAHTVEVYFRKSKSNTWEWHALVDGGELTGGSEGVAEERAAGILTFNSEGALHGQAMTVASDFDFIDATQNQVVSFDFGDDIATGGTGLQGTTQYASDSEIRNRDQDGYGASG